MMEHAEETIDMSESMEATWRNYLREFNDKVWPIFQCYGYSKSLALTVWSIEQLRGRVEELIEQEES